jgi:hypothetical protein
MVSAFPSFVVSNIKPRKNEPIPANVVVSYLTAVFKESVWCVPMQFVNFTLGL